MLLFAHPFFGSIHWYPLAAVFHPMGPRNTSLLTARGKQARDVTWTATLKTRILDIKTRGADMCESSPSGDTSSLAYGRVQR